MSNVHRFPELVIGIAGPIGVDVDAITASIQRSLQDVHYKSFVIKLTTSMLSYSVDVPPQQGADFCSTMNYKIDYADALCNKAADLGFLSRVAIKSIEEQRKLISTKNDEIPVATAYIIRQFKRPEEIHLMRRVYGKQFILVSAYGSETDRKAILETKQKKSTPKRNLASDASAAVDRLIERDASEAHKFGGQQLRDTFHLADVFIDGITQQSMDLKLDRFFRSFFGLNTAAPTKDEYGMYAAKSASLRSTDLSRQIGAAIFSPDGEIIAQGCNEVPKAFGGTYWDLEEPDFRDIKLGFDPNDEQKQGLLRDLLERLWDNGFLSEHAKKSETSEALIEELTRKSKNPGDEDGALVGSAVMDLTEFGRVVHAEMCAICDAARLGRSVKGSTLYCTTFPCHNCTKHILASGIRRVVYMEPYPKSKAKELHKDEIELEKTSTNRVSFVPFLGIAPYRYRDIFQKDRKRKDKSGSAKIWYAESGEREPMLDAAFTGYRDREKQALFPLIGGFTTERDEGGPA